MKKIHLLFVSLLFVNIVFSQVPQRFSYQAALRGSNGQVIANKAIKIRLSFLNGSATGTNLYTEEHSGVTNSVGLINLEAGGGTKISGDFADINWSLGEIWIKIEIDENLTGTFLSMGSTKLLSVPYALFAASGNPGPQGIQGPQGPQGVQGPIGPQGIQGPLGLVNKGSWTSGNSYISGDYVFDTGSSGTNTTMWVCQSSSSFISTVQPKDDLTNWTEFQAPQGPPGPQGAVGATGAPGISVAWLGDLPSRPSTPTLNQAYYNTTTKIAEIWNGLSWCVLSKDGAQGAQGATGAAGSPGTNGAPGTPGSNGISIQWLGSFTSAPTSPTLNQAYYNSTDKKSYIYSNSVWNLMTQSGADGTNGLNGVNGQNGSNGQDGISIQWLGSYSSAPAATLNQAYYNITDKKSYVYNGTEWKQMTQDGIIGPVGPQGPAGTGLVNKGNWSSSASYASGDYVFDRSSLDPLVNSMWICSQARTATATHPYQDLTYWSEFKAPQGPQGIQGEQGVAGTPGSNGVSIVWRGTYASAPPSPLLNYAYYNSTDKKSYVYNGSTWQIIAQDGMPISGTTGQTLYYNGTAWTPVSNLLNDGTNVGVGATPTQKLDVNGSLRLRSTLFDFNNSSGSLNQILTNGASGVLWQNPSALSVASGTGTNGQLALWSGVNSLQGVSNLTWGTSLQVASLPSAGINDPILEVKNKDGKVVFGVYQTGVRIYVEDSPIVKAEKGGFAVGGLSNQSKGVPAEYFRITSDSARVYINETTAKGEKGGFAVGGLSNQSKTVVSRNIMYVAPDSTRVYVNENVAKGAKGGFAVGGLSNQGKGSANNFMQMTPDNYFIGHGSGSKTTTGLYNNFLGYQAGLNNKTGSNNSFIGYQSGLNNTTGHENAFIGYNAGYSNAVGANNVFLGVNAGYTNNANNNVFLGYQSGNYNQSGENNVFLGTQSGYTNQSGSFNTFLGYNAGFYNTASYNSFMGYQAGKANTSGAYNTFSGYNAGLANTTGEKNVFVGFESGRTNTTGTSNVALGTNAGYNSNGSNNILIGEGAGYSITSGQHNTFIGSSAGYSQTYVLYNVMIGTSAGYHVNTTGFGGSFNVFMGINTGYQLARSRDNTLLGSNAGYWIENGQGNTFIGSDAGRGGADRTPPWVAGTNASEQNTTIGFKSSENIQTGGYNVALGAYAGNTNVGGSKNVFLGYQAGYSETGSNKLYISNSNTLTPLIYGDFSTLALTVNGSLNVTSTLSLAGVRKDQNWDNGYNYRLTSATGTAPLTLTLSSNGLTGSVADASISAKGAVQLSNSYSGTSQTLATTEKALSDGLATKMTSNGLTVGKIYLSGTGTIISAYGGQLVLTKSGATMTLTNNTGTYCHVWWHGYQSAAVSGSITMDNPVGTTLVFPAFTANGQGMEIHFGLESGVTYCSVWLSYSNSKVFGHYEAY